jgi:hypothetical protein
MSERFDSRNVYIITAERMGYSFKFEVNENIDNPKVILYFNGLRFFAYTRGNCPLITLQEHLMREALDKTGELANVEREIHDKRVFATRGKKGADEFLLYKQSQKIPKTDKSYRASRRSYYLQNS